MKIILIALVLAFILWCRCVYKIYACVTGIGKGKPLPIVLPASFYVKEVIGLACILTLLYALDPVPAGFAVAAVTGIFVNLLISVY
ncbi:MAG: hypothetical protein ACNA8K_09220 [Cyclonatronaceae bacterium]